MTSKKRLHALALAAVTASVSVVSVVSFSGCAAIESLFPAIETGNVKADVTAFVTIAEGVSSWASQIWALLPASTQEAGVAAYAMAQGALGTAVQLAEDLLAGYESAAPDAGSPNWAGVFAAVVSAADALVAEIQSLAATPATPAPPAKSMRTVVLGPSISSALAQLVAQQKTLHTFAAPK